MEQPFSTMANGGTGQQTNGLGRTADKRPWDAGKSAANHKKAGPTDGRLLETRHSNNQRQQKARKLTRAILSNGSEEEKHQAIAKKEHTNRLKKHGREVAKADRKAPETADDPGKFMALVSTERCDTLSVVADTIHQIVIGAKLGLAQTLDMRNREIQKICSWKVGGEPNHWIITVTVPDEEKGDAVELHWLRVRPSMVYSKSLGLFAERDFEENDTIAMFAGKLLCNRDRGHYKARCHDTRWRVDAERWLPGTVPVYMAAHMVYNPGSESLSGVPITHNARLTSGLLLKATQPIQEGSEILAPYTNFL